MRPVLPESGADRVKRDWRKPRSRSEWLRKPKRRRMGGAAAFISTEPKAVAKVSKPLCAADMPKASCIISGNRNGCAPCVMRESEPAITDTRNVLIRIRLRSRIGVTRAPRAAHRRHRRPR